MTLYAPDSDSVTETVQAVSPGKLILSGEHAVVYGCPALVMAVNANAEARLGPVKVPVEGKRDGITIHLHPFQQSLVYSGADLEALKARVFNRLQQFLEGQMAVTDVLPNHWELTPFALAMMADGVDNAVWPHLQLDVNLNMPVGSGMGSSAALGLAVLRAACALHPELPNMHQLLLDLSLTCERLLHGRPSGVDSTICLDGGCIRFERGVATPLPVPSAPLSFYQTGNPLAGTGECVMKVAKTHKTSAIWTRFHAVCEHIETAIRAGDHAALADGIRTNHALLCEIGVVPARVQRAVAEIEAAGGAAKLCGAGSVRGDNGGVLMVLDQAPAGWKQTWNYKQLKFTPDSHGTRLV